MKKGYLITLEGGEGSGKSEQARLLKGQLEEWGFSGDKLLALREPGGTNISEQIRTVIKNPENIEMNYVTELLLFEAARAQLVVEKILPFLENTEGVCLLDRFRDSTDVYQGLVRGLGIDTTTYLNNLVTKNLEPDLTLFFDIDPEIGLLRKKGEGFKDRLDDESLVFHEAVRNGFKTLIQKDETGRWITIDGAKSISEVQDEVNRIVWGRLFESGLVEGSARRGERI
jgi:dTMP kinase